MNNDLNTDIAENLYGDIISLPHHVSKVRQRMSMEARAAQFAPFAALDGHDDAIVETARPTDRMTELADDEKMRLDEALFAALRTPGRKAAITYFEPDRHKSRGRFITVTDTIASIDFERHTVCLSGGIDISIARIRDLKPVETSDEYDRNNNQS